MDTAIEIIETIDIPIAVQKAKLKDICLERINVSKAIDVNSKYITYKLVMQSYMASSI
jgi:hypothetical protein